MSSLNVTARSSLCLVIGDPIAHSLSPAMHNAGYEALGLPFVMAAARVSPEQLADAVRGMRALAIRGLAVTMPHKVSIIPFLDRLDPVAKAIGAVNTVVNDNGTLTGHNTDWIGIVNPLMRIAPLKGVRVALLGAGGAALAAAYGCSAQGASVTIFNRTPEKARPLAALCGGEVRSLAEAASIRDFDIIINTTSVGMGESAGESPIPADVITQRHIVFETIYHPFSTQLTKDGEARGARVLRGFDMFIEQGLAQFELHTGVKGPREVMQRILIQSLNP